MSSLQRRAAFFDMDRTLVRVNTGGLYVKWQMRNGRARRRDLARTMWWLTQYSFGVIDAEAIARRAASGLRGQNEAALRDAMRDWFHSDVVTHVADAARAEVSRRHANGSLCVILTSSTPYAAGPLAEVLGIEHVLATNLEVVDGLFTGNVEGRLCYGSGKVTAAEQWARKHDVDLSQSSFFTDSISDLPMLDRVGEPVVINPDPRLWIAAQWRRWRIENW